MASIVLPSSRFISELSNDVKISNENINSLAHILLKAFKEKSYDISKWKDHPLNPDPSKIGAENALNWIFTIDVLNFCFWSKEEGKIFSVLYNDKIYTGYWSLCASINRALDEGIPITSPQFMKSIDLNTMKHVFRSSNDVEIPLLNERFNVLKEAGEVITDKFGGSVLKMVEAAKNSAEKLVEIIYTNFTSFQDEAQYKGKQVKFLKRAQILVADIWACFEGKDIGYFNDIDEAITMFADYRVPQALAYFGVIEYSESLLERLKTNPHLEKGSELEIEIRGNSIWSVEILKNRIKELLEKDPSSHDKSIQINSILIDFYLWDYAKQHSDDLSKIPIHKTVTIFY